MTGQVVVVTGASGGIGRAVATAFGARGARSRCWPAARKDWPGPPEMSAPAAAAPW